MALTLPVADDLKKYELTFTHKICLFVTDLFVRLMYLKKLRAERLCVLKDKAPSPDSIHSYVLRLVPTHSLLP